jgi:hypothetical protein
MIIIVNSSSGGGGGGIQHATQRGVSCDHQQTAGDNGSSGKRRWKFEN